MTKAEFDFPIGSQLHLSVLTTKFANLNELPDLRNEEQDMANLNYNVKQSL